MGKTAVVTGASQGVGREICKRLAMAGWHVVGLARSAAKLIEVKNEIGDGFSFSSCDVKILSQVEQVFQTIINSAGGIDLLVNNAAVFKLAKFTESTQEDVDKIIDTNLKGTIFCTLEALKGMKPGARIVNIASVAALHGIKNQALYCASKFGVDGFSEALNQETIEKGVLITTICPGGIDTPLWNSQNPYPGESKSLLQPSDLADAVEFVAKLPARVVLKKMTLFPANEWH